MYLRVVSDFVKNQYGSSYPVANIQVINGDTGDLVADVCVEIYYCDKPRVILTPAIELRESEEATLAIDLVTGENIPL